MTFIVQQWPISVRTCACRNYRADVNRVIARLDDVLNTAFHMCQIVLQEWRARFTVSMRQVLKSVGRLLFWCAFVRQLICQTCLSLVKHIDGKNAALADERVDI